MKAVFADSYYYLAFINPRDAGHQDTIRFAQSFVGRTITTEWVLAEVADALSAPEQRPLFLELLALLRQQPGLQIVEAEHRIFERGVELFEKRPDKAWSLTDCISFVVMHEHGILEDLTVDHHFEQAGYILLLQ